MNAHLPYAPPTETDMDRARRMLPADVLAELGPLAARIDALQASTPRRELRAIARLAAAHAPPPAETGSGALLVTRRTKSGLPKAARWIDADELSALVRRAGSKPGTVCRAAALRLRPHLLLTVERAPRVQREEGGYVASLYTRALLPVESWTN